VILFASSGILHIFASENKNLKD